MRQPRSRPRPLALLICLTVGPVHETARAGGPMIDAVPIAEAAREAVERVRPFVVQVQPIGGRESALDTLGPTTGVYLPEHGCVVTSRYRVVDAAGLIVFFEGGRRSAATLLATDTKRKIALLRLGDPPEPFESKPTTAPREDLQVGQTTIAVGRVYRADEPNLAIGVLSASRRLLGLAVQTDANTSPANYGGPLIDLRGRVIGLLTPLAPEGGAAPGDGAGWYDSGIGFAVPWSDIEARLPRLLAGEDILPGQTGISLKTGNPHRTPAVVSRVHPAGPAGAAGVKPGDRVVSVGGSPTPTKMAYRSRVAAADAGAEAPIVVDRDGERLEFTLQLVAKLPAVVQPDSQSPADGESETQSIEET